MLAQAADADTADFGGVDLVARLEARVAPAGPIGGRIEDVNNGFGDANVIGQSYAAQGLDQAGSLLADSATDFLLDQQCAAGFFRLQFSAKDAASQTCADGEEGSEPDTDATALAVLALASQADDTDVAAHLARAVAWLLRTQNADGSFNGGTSTEGANANSTGLASWALGDNGAACAAAKAAGWVLGLRVTAPAAGSPLADDEGAIAYDAAGLASGRADGIAEGTQDQWRRATFQAAPALQNLLSEAPGAKLTGPNGFVKAGRSAKLTLSGLAAGDTICIAGPGVPARQVTGNGTTVSFPVASGYGHGQAHLRVAAPGVVDDHVVPGARPEAAADRPEARAAAHAHQAARQGEQAGRRRAVQDRDPRRGHRPALRGVANRKGIVKFRFRVGHQTGRVKVKAVGKFATRRGVAKFTVVR